MGDRKGTDRRQRSRTQMIKNPASNKPGNDWFSSLSLSLSLSLSMTLSDRTDLRKLIPNGFWRCSQAGVDYDYDYDNDYDNDNGSSHVGWVERSETHQSKT